MTTEDDFQNALDACPEDWQTRLVFADWLQERGDVRAEGYRALGTKRHAALKINGSMWSWWKGTQRGLRDEIDHGWWKLLNLPLRDGASFHKVANTRREAEDAAALAFAKLPAERRAELLATTSTAN